MKKEDFDLELLCDFLNLSKENDIFHIHNIYRFLYENNTKEGRVVTISLDITHNRDNVWRDKIWKGVGVIREEKKFDVNLNDYNTYLKKIDRNRKIGGLLK